MIRYKLTDQNIQTLNGFQWKLGEEKTASGEGGLCSSGWLHCYTHPLLAVLLNPIHANISKPLLFEAEVSGKMKDDSGLKQGFTSMTLIKQLDLPKISATQKVAFAILCAKKVSKSKGWSEWADKWLSGEDRSQEAAAKARAEAAEAVKAWAAARAAARAAAKADIDLIALAEEAMGYK